jgi:urease accessory protein
MNDRSTIDSVLTGVRLQAPAVSDQVNRWQAQLNLDFNTADGRSYLAKKQHHGPMVIQKTLHPEGPEVCHGIIIHQPGGVAGGDELILQATLAAGANVLLTTPGAGKWYKANGSIASQSLQFDLGENSSLEWLPQENILFDGAMVDFSANIHLRTTATYAGWDILCFGRLARGESWQLGTLKQNLTIKRDHKIIWQERSVLRANERFFHSLIGMAGNVVSANFTIAAGVVPADLLAECQKLQLDGVSQNPLDPHARFGVTVLPAVFSARYIGMSAPAARQYFEQLWHILRPWYGQRAAVRPRIWNT